MTVDLNGLFVKVFFRIDQCCAGGCAPGVIGSDERIIIPTNQLHEVLHDAFILHLSQTNQPRAVTVKHPAYNIGKIRDFCFE